MKQSLLLRQSQQLAMTPQLRQAIRLLQLSTTELHSEIQDALDSNLMLEVDEGDGAATDTEAGVAPSDIPAEPPVDMPEPDEDDGAGADTETGVVPADIPAELPVDSVWEDIYYDAGPASAGLSNAEFDDADLVAHRAQAESLKDLLHQQIAMLRLSDTDRAIAVALVDAVGDDGYLELPLDDIRQGLDPGRQDVTIEEIEAVLRQIQHLDPPGVAARGLDECLAMQLRQLPADTEWRDVAITLVTEHLPALASKRHAELMSALGLDRHELERVVDLIRSLSPRPGSAVESAAPEYVLPDVFVRKERGRWKVELNPDAAPRLRINAHYANLVRRADDSADNTTLKSHLQEARWFIKSLLNRSETLLKTATCIVERQQGFLERGEEAMKPMVLADVAQAIGMHESTISRVTTRKYMHPPRGLFELKYFFSSHVGTAGGAQASSTAIRAVLRKLIAAENPTRPLSDQKLKEILAGQGIRIARRTVAKYREEMRIPSSTERKAV